MNLTEQQIDAFLKFAERANFSTFADPDVSDNKEEAYEMRNAVYAVAENLNKQAKEKPMMTSTYTAYGAGNKTIKTGAVTYENGATDKETAMNFGEAVVADVGEDVFENEVIGIRD